MQSRRAIEQGSLLHQFTFLMKIKDQETNRSLTWVLPNLKSTCGPLDIEFEYCPWLYKQLQENVCLFPSCDAEKGNGASKICHCQCSVSTGIQVSSYVPYRKTNKLRGP
jgi:hypothetical protein